MTRHTTLSYHMTYLIHADYRIFLDKQILPCRGTMEGPARVAEDPLHRGGIATNLGHSIATVHA